jgi:protein gp37
MRIKTMPDGLHIIRSENPKYKPVMNATNDSIEWAKWTWNPVTGCLHDCPYCYAKAMAENPYYATAFPTGFSPAFHPGRLDAPANTKIPDSRKDEIGIHNVFVCSMADLFGAWVPADWIQQVIDVCRKHPEFNFLFLTKNPKRYLEFAFPENAWLGATADTQVRYDAAHEAFEIMYNTPINSAHNIQFLSCEPLSEYLEMNAEKNERNGTLLFDWCIVGGFKNGKQPEWRAVENILTECRKSGVQVYFKPNLTVRPMEYPKKI